MNTALQIISIQHELVLTLNSSSALKETLQQFLRICNMRLNLSSSHIFLYQNQQENPCAEDALCSEISIKHYVSLPTQRRGEAWSSNSGLLAGAIYFSQANKSKVIEEKDKQCLYFFKIKHYGVMIVEYEGELSETLQKTLEPVLERLSMCCAAAIDHAELITEIEARKVAEERIRYKAAHDDLTDLYNRRELTKRLDAAIHLSTRKDSFGALIFLCLNDFKSINDLMGHNAGDKILKQMADRILAVVSKKYTVARFGGNQFMVLLDGLNCRSIDDFMQSEIEKIIDAISDPFCVENSLYSFSCSVGYDVFSLAKGSAVEVIKHADLAMRKAKRIGAAYGVAYDKEMSEKLDQKVSYNAELKKALEKDEFELHYQPQLDNDQNVIGAEALLRWNNPLRGYESPAVYIPIAEESDLIIHISEWVLNQACKDIKMLESKGYFLGIFKKISINISAKHLAKDNFVESILSAIVMHDIDPHHLAIEITEGVMVGDVDRSIEMLECLRSHGVECSIDDFGTGYSSLTYLKKLPASLVKIDRAFVQNIHIDNENRSIAQMIISLGENLNMDVIAEGVECQEEVDCLLELGCNQYQGFFFCKPIAMSAFVELMNARRSTVKTNITLSSKHSEQPRLN